MTNARTARAAPRPAAHQGRAFCVAMLPKVSRTFAICIRLLPPRLEPSVLVAYLLCRVADTIEDATRLTPTDKVRLLAYFRSCLAPEGADATVLRAAFEPPRSDEEVLAREADTVLREFRRLPRAHQDAVRPWVQEMCDGMAEFVERSRAATAGGVEALATVEDLDRYCYFVAGTVGHLLTELFHLHDGRGGESRRLRLRALATSFGLGLQLTNIIKDVADDRRRGWSFVPRQLCQLAGISPEELQDAGHQDQARRVMRLLIEKAKRHLLDALEYSTHLPRRAYGIRLFCLSSLYFAVRTLRLAEGDPRLLDPTHKVKITRAQVWRTLAMTRLLAPVNTLVKGYFRWLAGPEWWGRRTATLAPALLALSLAAPPAGAQQVARVEVTPARASVIAGQTASFRATAFDAAGRPVTDAPAMWLATPPRMRPLGSPWDSRSRRLRRPLLPDDEQ